VIEQITVSAGGQTFRGIKALEVDAAFDHGARSFHFEIAPSPVLLKTFAPGTTLQIASNGDLLCSGYVDRLAPSFTSLEVSGRTRAADFIDCAAIDPNGTGNFEGQTPLQIAQALAKPFGVAIATDQTLDPVDDFKLTPGEKAFATVERLVREQGLTISGQADGSLFITKPGTSRHAGGLFEGQNILARGAKADLNWAHRHSPIIVRGQSSTGTGDADLQVEATASDGAVSRYRPLVVIEDRDLDQATAQSLADARSQREAGESLKAHIPVRGFHDSAGKLWTPGWLVWVESAMLGLQQAMLIRRAPFRKAAKGGSTTRLELVDPRAFGGTAAKGSKTGNAGDIWSVGAPAIPFTGGVLP
jgi:prophage tail gpP-like protein